MNEKKISEEFIIQIAKKAYEEGNAKFDIYREKVALLVIDMQDEFVKPYWTPYWVPDASKQVPKIKELIEYCRKNAIPVIFTVFSKTYDYLDRPKTGGFMPNRYSDLKFDRLQYFIEGHVWHELEPQTDEIIIHKPSYGAFYDTPLETILKNLERDTVIICGTLTNFCCGMTARQAYERGFKVIFGSDITSTDDPNMQDPELKVLRKGFAKVMTLNEIIEKLK